MSGTLIERIPDDTPDFVLSAECQCGHLFTNHLHDRVLGECEMTTCSCTEFVGKATRSNDV